MNECFNHLCLHFLVVSGFLQLEISLRFSDFNVVKEAGSQTFFFRNRLFDLRIRSGLSETKTKKVL